MAFSAFSIRRLSPFLGTTQVLETDNARATSTDGVNWRIDVRCRVPAPAWGSLDKRGTRTRLAAYGAWSNHDGLVRLPLNPVLQLPEVQAAAEDMLKILPSASGEVPFMPGDAAELWLLDHDDLMPLALIASAVDAGNAGAPSSVVWRPTLPGESVAVDDGDDAPSGLATVLAQRVADAAGRPPRTQWFQRAPDGGGAGRKDARVEARDLPAAAFPPLLLRTDWSEPDTRRLTEHYVEWLAPLLLTLPGLTQALRTRLERAARRRPLTVAASYHLYPEIVDRDALDAVLVEARIRAAAGEHRG